MGLFASSTAQLLRPQEQKVPCGSICRISRTSPTALPTPCCTKPFHSSLHSAISPAPQDKLQLAGAVSFIFWPLCPSPFQPVFSALLGVGGEPSPGGRTSESSVGLSSVKSCRLDPCSLLLLFSARYSPKTNLLAPSLKRSKFSTFLKLAAGVTPQAQWEGRACLCLWSKLQMSMPFDFPNPLLGVFSSGILTQ